MAVTKRLRFEILRRDNHTCQSCGAKPSDAELVVDHVIPVALGGSDEPANLQTLCAPCNSGKSATPPDAATVSRVANDAARWAQAMQAAASQLEGAQTIRASWRAAFDDRWLSWSQGRPPLPRPMGWERSVDAFAKAGLPLSVLLECVDIAMSARQVKADAVFRYACGAAWKEVKKLQTVARESLTAASDSTGDADPKDFEEFRRGRYDAAHDLLGNLADDEQEKYRDQVRERGEDASDPVELEVDAAQTAFTDFVYECQRLQAAVNDLLASVPQESSARWREIALDEIRANEGENFSAIDVLVQTAREAKQERQFHDACVYLSSLPVAEKDEWIACATTYLGYDRDPSHLIRVDIKAAEYAQSNKADRIVLAGMCGGRGEHGAMCPQAPSYLMRLEGCVGCGDTCFGHLVCMPHLELLVDGKISSRTTGKVLMVIDFKELKAEPDEEPPF